MLEPVSLDGCGHVCFVCSADRQIGSEVESGLLVLGIGVVHVASLGAQAILQQRLRSDRELLFVGM